MKDKLQLIVQGNNDNIGVYINGVLQEEIHNTDQVGGVVNVLSELMLHHQIYRLERYHLTYEGFAMFEVNKLKFFNNINKYGENGLELIDTKG